VVSWSRAGFIVWVLFVITVTSILIGIDRHLR